MKQFSPTTNYNMNCLYDSLDPIGVCQSIGYTLTKEGNIRPLLGLFAACPAVRYIIIECSLPDLVALCRMLAH